MEYIKQYAFSICASALAATLCHMMLPNSNISKVLKTAISVFFLASLLSPFLIDFDILGEIERYTPITQGSQQEALQEETNEYVIQQFELKIKELILTDLKEISIDPVNITVTIKENADSLFVENVEIFLKPNDARYKTDIAIRTKNITQCQPQIYLTEVE